MSNQIIDMEQRRYFELSRLRKLLQNNVEVVYQL